MSYATDFTLPQSILAEANSDGVFCRLRKHTSIEILNAIAYVVRTGCQWSMLPSEFPPHNTVYHHFRSLGDRGWFHRFLGVLVRGKRCAMGQPPDPEETVVDSQSVRTGLPDAEKGIDGHKRIKGIKRHLAVDSNGYPLGVRVSCANVHDSRGAAPLLGYLLFEYKEVGLVKGDKGYRALEKTVESILDLVVICVKSNFGTSEFIPLEGRWVVERTFSWMDSYRRLTRNYEKRLDVAANMFIAGCVMFMLRYFR